MKDEIRNQKKDIVPKIVFDPSVDPWKAESLDIAARQAIDKAHAHVEVQRNIPEVLKHALLQAEVNFFNNDGNVAPVVQIDDSKQLLRVPERCNEVEFLQDCLIRFAQSYVSLGYVSENDDLCVIYISKGVEYLATCKIKKDGTLGNWRVRNSLFGRNDPCPCGSGRKYKKCCRNRPKTILSKDEFAEQYIRRVNAAGETASIEYDSERFVLLCDGDVCMNLSNAYDEYANTPDGLRDGVLCGWVRGWFICRREFPKCFEDVKPDLLLQVQSRACIDTDTPFLPVGDHLGVQLAYNMPDSMAIIKENMLREWGVGFDEAYEAGLQNLREISPPKFERQLGGFYIATYRDHYDPSRLLLPEIFTDLDLCGDPLVMLPNRNTLLVTGADDVQGVMAMADFAMSLIDKPRFRSGVALTFVGGTWQTYRCPADHPASTAFHELTLNSLAAEYAHQQDTLEEQHLEDGIDVFVADYSLCSVQSSNECLSYCVWNEGSASLLPRSEFIGFADEAMTTAFADGNPLPSETTPIMASWEAVEEVAGDLLVPLGTYPERYLVEKFPSAEQLDILRREHNMLDRFAGENASGAPSDQL